MMAKLPHEGGFGLKWFGFVLPISRQRHPTAEGRHANLLCQASNWTLSCSLGAGERVLGHGVDYWDDCESLGGSWVVISGVISPLI